MTGKKPGPPLTPEEEALWKEATQHDIPLPGRKKRAEPQAKRPVRRVPAQERPPDAPLAFEALPELACGRYDGVDRHTGDRLRKGHYPIEARLDLHGKTAAQAESLVKAFIHAQYRRGARCLLIITGKGTRAQEAGERSVLRGLLPIWLGHPDIRPFVLVFDQAQIRHGGSGAFYILLRRER